MVNFTIAALFALLIAQLSAVYIPAYGQPGTLFPTPTQITKVDTIAPVAQGGSRYNLRELKSTDLGIAIYEADDSGLAVAVQVLGYYLDENGDSDGVFESTGNGLYQLVHDAALADNGGTVIAADNSFDSNHTANDAFWVLAERARNHRSFVDAKLFGAVGDGIADDAAAIQSAVDYAAESVSGGSGRIVYLPVGTYLIGHTILLPNRVGVEGSNCRGTVIKPHADFAGSYMFHAVNGMSSAFNSWIKDVHINAKGKNMTAVIMSENWQENCGMERVVIEFDGTTSYGFRYTNGYGGAAYLSLRDVEIFADSTSSTAQGIQIDQISKTGGFVLSLDGVTIAGTSDNNLVTGVNMVNDSLWAKGLHIEYCTTGVAASGMGGLSIDTFTGSSNAVVDMVTVDSSFSGQVDLRNIIPRGATGQIFKNKRTGRNIAASEGSLSHFSFSLAGFSAYLSVQQADVSGNGTEATLICDTEIYDNRDQYNNATGVFTAPRAGIYSFNLAAKLSPGTQIATCVLKLVTTSREYIVFRGSTDNLLDASGYVTLSGTFSADMGAGQTARVKIVASGIAGDTLDIEPTETIFQGAWVNR